MKRNFALACVTAVMAGGMTLGTAGGALAGHCVAPAGEPSAPGFSYFGTDHVQEADHTGEEAGQPEGAGRHMGTAGASNCRETTGTPSDRAPGRE